ncbi:MAG TPA: hypothetical protein VND40_01930, partial [Nitrososphaerales archaeon]|nr:hypothetical protein [Nitrososphaerales archaeon]
VILPRKGCEDESDPLKRYIAFATNIPRRFVMWNVRRLPDDYRRRWGISHQLPIARSVKSLGGTVPVRRILDERPIV